MARSNTQFPKLATLPRKEALFEDFCINLLKTADRIENLLGVPGLKSLICGYDCDLLDDDLTAAKEKIRGSRTWLIASELYDYAVEGIDRTGLPGSVSDGTSSLVIDAGEIIALLTGEESKPSTEWHAIVTMADGRVALEEGLGLSLEQVALLANVDVRTVRNVVSSGALVCDKSEEFPVDSDSARLWLLGRKGFKPTVSAGAERINLSEVESADAFGAYLRERRAQRQQRLSADGLSDQEFLLTVYPGLTQEILREVEAGVFRVPLKLIKPLADFYEVSREELLDCVMRVFFPEELEMLSTKLGRSRLNLVPGSAGKEGV